MGFIDFACCIEQLAQLVESPQPKRLGYRVVEDVGTIAILYQLAEPTLHQLVAQDAVGQEGMLVGSEQWHRLSRERATHQLQVGISKEIDKSIHTFGCSLTQRFVGRQ